MKSVELVYLSERGIDEREAADLRLRLAPFAEDWNRPEMSVYDYVENHYDESQS